MPLTDTAGPLVFASMLPFLNVTFPPLTSTSAALEGWLTCLISQASNVTAPVVATETTGTLIGPSLPSVFIVAFVIVAVAVSPISTATGLPINFSWYSVSAPFLFGPDSVSEDELPILSAVLPLNSPETSVPLTVALSDSFIAVPFVAVALTVPANVTLAPSPKSSAAAPSLLAVIAVVSLAASQVTVAFVAFRP